MKSNALIPDRLFVNPDQGFPGIWIACLLFRFSSLPLALLVTTAATPPYKARCGPTGQKPVNLFDFNNLGEFRGVPPECGFVRNSQENAGFLRIPQITKGKTP